MFEGLELSWDPLRGVFSCCLSILIKKRLKAVVCHFIELFRGKEDFLRLGREEFRVAEEVVAVLREVEVELVPVPSEHIRRGYFRTPGLQRGLQCW